jgi:OFA family oxalate/formate antiporter-like MFS transporter
MCSGAGVGIGYTGIITTITKWFPEKVGVASGVMLMGFGLGSLILGSIANIMIAGLGLFLTFRILAAATAAVLIAGSIIIREPEAEAADDEQNNITPAGNQLQDECSLKPSEMMRTARYWIFLVWAILLNAAGLMVINSAASIAVAFGGSAILGMVVSLFNGIGRIIAGNNFDRLGRKMTTLINIIFMITAGILMILGNRNNSLIMIAAGLIFVGMAYGGVPTIVSAYINRAFGAENFTMNYSVTNPFSMLPAAILGPMISARLLERANGEYDSNFTAVLLFALAALAAWFFLNRASRGGNRSVGK